MGKNKNKKFKSKKPQPTGLSSVKDAEEEAAELTPPPSFLQTQISSLLDKILSSEEEDRACGCSSLAILVFNVDAIPLLLKNDIVKCVGPLLIDKSLAVREGAAGALRNLSVSGGYEVCDKMIEDDVLTSLVVLLKQCLEDVQTISNKKNKKDDALIGIMVQGMHLLWNLCESSSVAVNIFNKENLLPTLMQCLCNRELYGTELTIPTAQCLHIVTENNMPASQQLTTTDMLSLLESTLMSPGITYQNTLLKTLILCTFIFFCSFAGTIFNIKNNLPAGSQSQTMQAIVKILSDTLDLNSIEIVHTVIMNLGSANGVSCSESQGEETAHAAMAANDEDADIKESKTEDSINDVKCLLTAQQVALEITSNVCVSDDEEDEEWEDMNATSSSSSSSDDQTEHVMDNDNIAIVSPLCLSAEIHSALIAQNIPKKVLEKTSPGDRSTLQTIASHPKGQLLMKGLQTIQNRALTCLQNMISVMDTQALGGGEALSKLWTMLLPLAFDKTGPTSNEYVEAFTSAMRSLLQKMAANNQLPEVNLLCFKLFIFTTELGTEHICNEL
uniref:HEAT repeat-containing protein 3-like n=1 Tax=Saccoglossus kowalevskii TaxID=10224 RepID=A0ABM0ME34_SACKO|nr:PREDICTED: HEAT repeat-containing protein 3-like [Saccoglossus kowalevskii]